MFGRLLTLFLSILLLNVYSGIAAAQAVDLTRSENLGWSDWIDVPGQKVFFDSRSPLTVTDLMKGGGEPVKIEAHFWMPDNASGPVPAVVIFNCGSVEVEAKEGFYSDEFHRQGYAVINVNSLKTRVDQMQTGLADVFRYRNATIVDALEVLKTLAADPRIDPKRIAIIGWFNGGTSIMGAAIEEFRERYVGPDIRYAAIVPISPLCALGTIGAHFSQTPILSVHGGADDFAPLKPCEAYRQEALARGANFEMLVYPGIDHDWDMPFPVHFDTSQRAMNENCLLQTDLKEKALRLGDGTKIAYDNPDIRGIISKYIGSCATSGIHEGSDRKTKTDAIQHIVSFIKKSFDTAS